MEGFFFFCLFSINKSACNTFWSYLRSPSDSLCILLRRTELFIHLWNVCVDCTPAAWMCTNPRLPARPRCAPCFQIRFKGASRHFVMFSFWLRFVYGLDPHSIYHCKQLLAGTNTHSHTHTPHKTWAHSCGHEGGPALKIWPHLAADIGGQQRASQDSRTDRRERFAISGAASCCPRAPASCPPTVGLILPPAAEAAMPSGSGPKVATQELLCASVLFSALFSLSAQSEI